MSEVLAHLMCALPLSASGETNPQIGIAERVRQLQAAMAGQDVGVVGLHGMGVKGKTTLAKAFFAVQGKAPSFRRRVLLHVGQEAEKDVLEARYDDACPDTNPDPDPSRNPSPKSSYNLPSPLTLTLTLRPQCDSVFSGSVW